MQNNYTYILKDIDEAHECKENKNHYLVELKQQIHNQKEKISRADKNLQNAQRDIQQIFAITGDKTVLTQEVCKLYEVFHDNYIVFLINLLQ